MSASLAGALNKVKAKFSNNEINRKVSPVTQRSVVGEMHMQYRERCATGIPPSLHGRLGP